MRVSAVIPAAGSGKRLKSGLPKPFVPVFGKPLLVRTLKSLLGAYLFKEVVVLAHPSHRSQMIRLLKRYRITGVRVEDGGSTRADSVRRGVLSLLEKPDWVLIHDAARPFVDRSLVLRTLNAALSTGAAICAVPVTATVKRLRETENAVLYTEDRRCLRLAQTPQVFRRDLLLERYRSLGAKALKATDEAALFDKSPVRVRVVEGDERNIKVTTPQDLELLRYYLKKK